MAKAKQTDVITVRVPIEFRRRRGRKSVTMPEGSLAFAPSHAPDSDALVKALARAFRWRRLIETGVHATVRDLAISERVNPSYLSRILRLTLLAPDIVEGILNGGRGSDITLDAFMKPFRVEWPAQRNKPQKANHFPAQAELSAGTALAV